VFRVPTLSRAFYQRRRNPTEVGRRYFSNELFVFAIRKVKSGPSNPDDFIKAKMKTKLIYRTLILMLLGGLLAVPANLRAATAPQPNIGVNGYYASDKAQRGRTVQAAIVIDIPGGYHVNANRPLGKYAIATTLKVEAPRGVTVSAVTYPRAIVRKLKAVNNEPLAVYEGRAILRFNVTVPANYQGGEVVLKAQLRYQSCNDEVCFPPKNQDVNLGIGVVGPNDRVQRANGWVFGGRR
jgi:DsbC/DsbD-like thiol-disulfide interchange protein